MKNTLRKRFIAVESDTLVIQTEITQTPLRGNDHSSSLRGVRQGSLADDEAISNHLRILKLKGIWRANDYNELCFEVTGRKGPPEIYTFKGSWKLNNNQQIEYISEDGRDKLTFRGYWNISSANRLVYLLEGNLASRFEFKVQLESPTLYPKKGQIRYRIGVGMRQSRRGSLGQTIILYGEWKLGRNLGLTFQMDYGQGKVRSVEFGATVTFGRNKVIFALKNELGEPLGITLTMTHKFLGHLDAHVFVRLKSRQKAQAIEAGISIPF